MDTSILAKIIAGHLEIERCPHCGTARPAIVNHSSYDSAAFVQRGDNRWSMFGCRTCGSAIVVQTKASDAGQTVVAVYPKERSDEVAEQLPERSKIFLREAIRAANGGAPSAAIMAAASAVDAMLKAKEYRQGSLYVRIDQAAADHLITKDVAAWAHEVRLEANDQRHADEEAPLPTPESAVRVVEFAEALGEILFVLPSRVSRGIERAKAPG